MPCIWRLANEGAPTSSSITRIVRIGTPAVAHENPAARADRHAKIVGGWVSLAA